MFPVTCGRRAVLVGCLALAAAGCAAQIQRAAVPATLVQDASVPGLAHARFWGDEAPKDVLAFVREHMPGMGRPAGRMQNKGPQLVEYLNGLRHFAVDVKQAHGSLRRLYQLIKQLAEGGADEGLVFAGKHINQCLVALCLAFALGHLGSYRLMRYVTNMILST